MLYPNFESVDTLVTLHNDLYRPPEEFQKEVAKEIKGDDLGADVKEHLSLKHKERPLLAAGFLSFIKSGGKLPLLVDLPMMTFDGKTTDQMELENDAEDFADLFREDVGRCKKNDKIKTRIAGKTADLFCMDDKESA